ncbi:MAG: tetratricopeptide (TPR) repeat protein [Desulforhopalus sp.]|jgi:tetratricopeptide (TPR) repeat protein
MDTLLSLRLFVAKHTFLLSLLLLALLSSGCVIRDMGHAVKNSIAGEHFLTTGQYEKGIDSFKEEVTSNPDSHLANFYYGRFLLVEKQYKNALKYLVKARDLNPKKADYYFWVGVTYGSLGQKISERSNYKKALLIDKNHLQSLIYLGNNQLQRKQYSASLLSYTKALAIWPSSPTSLYNRALILDKLGRKPEALEGWQEYLSYYPSGAMARLAVNHLNLLNDYSFRNHTLLSRVVTIEKIHFIPFSAEIAPDSKKSLDFIATIAGKMKKGRLQIVVYQLTNKELAKAKAINIKKYILSTHPNLQKKDIGVSWFATPETIKIAKKKRVIHDSVSFFITLK